MNDTTAKWECSGCDGILDQGDKAPRNLDHKDVGHTECTGKWKRVVEVGTVTLWLECDCCGENAAPFPVRDGDRLQCGCSGIVACGEGDDGEPKAWTHDDLPCLNCREGAGKAEAQWKERVKLGAEAKALGFPFDPERHKYIVPKGMAPILAFGRGFVVPDFSHEPTENDCIPWMRSVFASELPSAGDIIVHFTDDGPVFVSRYEKRRDGQRGSESHRSGSTLAHACVALVKTIREPK